MNARSLIPKLDSFKDLTDELNAHVAVVTETWFNDSAYHEKILEDFQSINSCEFIRKDRRNGRRGGGVAIWFSGQVISMSRARLPHSKHEIVAAIGRRTGQRRKILVIGAYIPPWYNSAQNKNFYLHLNDCLTLLQKRYDQPYVIVAGDFNRRDFRAATSEFPEIKQLQTPPTKPYWMLLDPI